MKISVKNLAKALYEESRKYSAFDHGEYEDLGSTRHLYFECEARKVMNVIKKILKGGIGK